MGKRKRLINDMDTLVFGYSDPSEVQRSEMLRLRSHTNKATKKNYRAYLCLGLMLHVSM